MWLAMPRAFFRRRSVSSSRGSRAKVSPQLAISTPAIRTRLRNRPEPPGGRIHDARTIERSGNRRLARLSGEAVQGVAVIAADTTEPDMLLLRVRLGANMHQLEAIVLRLNRECMQAPAGC